MEQSLIRKSRKAVNASSILVIRWLANFATFTWCKLFQLIAKNIRRHRLTARTPPFQGGNRGSILRVARDA